MLSRVSRLNFNGAGSIFFKSLFNYCTTTQTARFQSSVLADFLIKSLGFSKEAAVRTSNKVTRSKPFENKPALVVNFLQNSGLTKSQIRRIVSGDPGLLFYDVDKTLDPKVKFFRELGLSGSDLGKLITACFLRTGLDSCIKPRTDYLRKLLGSDDKVVLAMKRCYFVLYYEPEMVEKNILLLRNFGIADENIAKMILWNPRPIFGTTPECLLKRLHRVEEDLGIPRDSPMFIYGVKFINATSQSNIDSKFGVLRSYGWSDEDILRMVRILPLSMNMSLDRMRRTLDYFMKELGYDIDYLASHPRLFTFNLEGRIKPRNEVLKILNGRNLITRKVVLYNAILLPEFKFLKDYVLPYKNRLPDMYESFIKKVQRTKD